MRLTILGSGTYQPELIRHPSSYLLEINKQKIIFDFGRGALDQLLKIGLNYYDLDLIFISHLHADHCSELVPFLQIAVAEPPTGKFRKKDMTIYGPKGIKKTINHLLRDFDLTQHQPKYNVFVKELKDASIVKGKGLVIKSFSVKHSVNINCLAYRLKSKSQVFCYSGDAPDCAGLRKACQKADLAIIETSWPKKFKPKEHLTGGQVGKVANECQVKKLILTHIAPYYLKNFDVIKDVKENYKGPVFIANDLMKISI